MSASPSVGLDHVGFIVSDLDATCGLLSQLGFTLTARADHTRTDEEGTLVSAGSSQRSIMLGNGYVELMEITDPRAGHQLAAAPSVRHGLHILAFGTEDAEGCREARAQQGLEVGPVLRWARAVNEVGLRGAARFAYFGADWRATDPSYLCWVQHLTPELIRSRHLLHHDNGAVGLAGIRYRGPHPQAHSWVERLKAAGAKFVTEGPEGVRLSLPNAWVCVDVDEQEPTVLPSVLELKVADGAWLRRQCRRLGIPCDVRADGGLQVDLRPQLGLEWICRDTPVRRADSRAE